MNRPLKLSPPQQSRRLQRRPRYTNQLARTLPGATDHIRTQKRAEKAQIRQGESIQSAPLIAPRESCPSTTKAMLLLMIEWLPTLLALRQ
jgi:hypothetical protein